MALLSGSIPIYKGTADIYKFLPCQDGECILDVAKFDSPQALARRMAEIASNVEEWSKMRAWRDKGPDSWGEGFNKLLHHAGTNLWSSMCHSL